jgi:hypothetical protein
MRRTYLLMLVMALLILGACQLATRSPASAPPTNPTPAGVTSDSPTTDAVTSTQVAAVPSTPAASEAGVPPPTATSLLTGNESRSQGVAANAALPDNPVECWATNITNGAINIYMEREMINVYYALSAGRREWITQIVHNQQKPEQIDWLVTRLPGGGAGYLRAEGLQFDPSSACAQLLAEPPPPVECIAYNIGSAAIEIYNDTARTQVLTSLAPNASIVVTDALINAQGAMMADWFVVRLADCTSGYLYPNGLSLTDSCRAIVPMS